MSKYYCNCGSNSWFRSVVFPFAQKVAHFSIVMLLIILAILDLIRRKRRRESSSWQSFIVADARAELVWFIHKDVQRDFPLLQSDILRITLPDQWYTFGCASTSTIICSCPRIRHLFYSCVTYSRMARVKFPYEFDTNHNTRSTILLTLYRVDLCHKQIDPSFQWSKCLTSATVTPNLASSVISLLSSCKKDVYGFWTLACKRQSFILDIFSVKCTTYASFTVKTVLRACK